MCIEFHMESWIGAILWCNIAFGFFVRIINMTVTEKFGIRIFINTCLNAIGVGGIILSLYIIERTPLFVFISLCFFITNVVIT